MQDISASVGFGGRNLPQDTRIVQGLLNRAMTNSATHLRALSFVAQHRQNTWPGVVAQTFGNSALLLQIVRGVTG